MKFDSRVAGTPATAWEDARLRLAPALDVGDCTELLVFAAHPDDETLGAATLIADFARRGLPVQLVVVTDGGASGEPSIVARRSAELGAALAVLAPQAQVTELGFGDSQTHEQRPEIGEQLGRIIRRADPGALLVSTWAGDGHRDHRVLGELVAEHADGRRTVAYPIWMWHWGDPSDPELPWSQFRVLPSDVELKSRAIREYRSQIEGAEPTLRPEMLEHFLNGRDVYIDLHTDPSPEPRLDAAYFDELHSRREDPWRFLTRWYEERKRAITIAALTRRRYASALEVGCSIGVLTAELAERCDELLAIDISPAAVVRARRRVGTSAQIEQRDVGEGFPRGPFDLIVLSEVGYYFSPDAIDAVLSAARDALTPEGELVACHWRHPVADYPLLGDEVHERLGALGIPRLMRHEEEDFLLEVFSRDSASVARREGLA